MTCSIQSYFSFFYNKRPQTKQWILDLAGSAVTITRNFSGCNFELKSFNTEEKIEGSNTLSFGGEFYTE